MIMMSMQFLGKANSMFRLWFVIGNFLCTIDSTVEVEAIGLVLLGSYNKCLPFSSANSEDYAHSAFIASVSCCRVERIMNMLKQWIFSKRFGFHISLRRLDVTVFHMFPRPSCI